MFFIVYFGLTGFRIYVFGLAICLGWEDGDAMIKGVATAAIILVTYMVLLLCGVTSYIIEPFESAIQVLGTNIVCMGLMVMTTRYYYERSDRELHCNKYTMANVGYSLFLGVCLLLGFVFQINGVKATALVYLVLFVLTKCSEGFFKLSDSKAVYIFFMAAAICGLSIWIHANPGFVVKMFTWKQN